jgi:hypothetical protein
MFAVLLREQIVSGQEWDAERFGGLDCEPLHAGDIFRRAKGLKFF